MLILKDIKNYNRASISSHETIESLIQYKFLLSLFYISSNLLLGEIE